MPDRTRGTCRSCHAAVIWVLTDHARRMPVDAEPVSAPRGFRLTDLDRDTIRATFTADPAPGERLYQSHFARCPAAAHYRKPA